MALEQCVELAAANAHIAATGERERHGVLQQQDECQSRSSKSICARHSWTFSLFVVLSA
jgi:hypothetical protein